MSVARWSSAVRARVAAAALLALPFATHGGDFDPFSTLRAVAQSPAKTAVPADKHGTPCRFATPGSPLSLVEAVERALCNNPQTRQAWASVKAQAAQLGVSQAAYVPTINTLLTATETNNTTSVKGFPQLDSRARGGARSGAVNLNWVLFDFGLRSANLESARQLLIAANAGQDAALQTVFVNAVQAYYDVLTAIASVDASRDSENAARESFQAAEAKYKAGVGALADKLQAQTSYSQATLNRVKAEGDLNSARGALAIVMGLSASMPIAPDTASTPMPDTAFVVSVDELIDEAKRTSPSILAAEAQWQAARAKASAIKAEGLPSVSLVAAANRNDQFGQPPAETYSRSNSVGLQVSIPLFEGFARPYRVRAAEAQAELKAAELANADLQVSLDVWTSYQSLRTETENLRTTDDLLHSARQSFEVAQGRYKAGVGSVLELLSAQSALASAEQQRIQATSNWRIARIRLAGSLGRLGFWAIESQ